MKKSIVLVFVAIFAMSTAFAKNVNPTTKKDPKTISEQVADLLEAPNFQVTEDVFATVKLVVNSQQEVIVLDVQSENEKVVDFVKSRLNYEKLNAVKAGDHLTLPLHIIPGE